MKSFRTERHLVNTLKRSYAQLCRWEQSEAKPSLNEEVNLGFGIADLVISRLASEVSAAAHELTYFDFTIYKIIETSKRITLEELRTASHSNPRTVQQTIKKLIAMSYVKRQDTILKISQRYRPVVKEAIAIEAKLRNWQRALLQAYRYRWFADLVYVVLDSRYVKQAQLNVHKFRDLGIGLASINVSGEIDIIYRPKKIKPINEKMQLVFNEFVCKNYRESKNVSHVPK